MAELDLSHSAYFISFEQLDDFPMDARVEDFLLQVWRDPLPRKGDLFCIKGKMVEVEYVYTHVLPSDNTTRPVVIVKASPAKAALFLDKLDKWSEPDTRSPQ